MHNWQNENLNCQENHQRYEKKEHADHMVLAVIRAALNSTGSCWVRPPPWVLPCGDSLDEHPYADPKLAHIAPNSFQFNVFMGFLSWQMREYLHRYLFPVHFLRLFSYYLVFPKHTSFCFILLYFISFHFISLLSLSACMLFNEKQKDCGPRWERMGRNWEK